MSAPASRAETAGMAGRGAGSGFGCVRMSRVRRRAARYGLSCGLVLCGLEAR
jgi:hypothetical protein